jgi:biotin carboxylase
MAHLVFVESIRPGMRALEVAQRLGHRVSYLTSHQADQLLTEEDLVARRRHSDLLLEVSDTRDVDVVTEGLRQAGQAQPIDAVLTTLHQYVEPSAAAAARLGLRATSVEGIRNARDKARCRDILAKRGIPSTRYRMVRTLEETLEALREIGYPAVIKPTTGVGKVLTTIAQNEAQVRDHFANAERNYQELRPVLRNEVTLEFVVEEFLRGSLYSMELGVSAHGEYSPYAILKRKLGKHNPILEAGSTIPTGLTDAQYDAAADYCSEVIKALGLDLGIFHVEFIYTAQGPRLVEVNPRIGGAVIPELIRNSTGGDMFEVLIRTYLGERIGIRRFPDSTTGTISTINVGSLEECVVRADLPGDWFETHFRSKIISGSVEVVAGQKLKKMEGNWDNLGVFRVRADSYAAAVQRAEDLRREMEQVLGIKIVEAVD